ncbi:hypothetical protein CN923_05845 [Bacillus cereus]|nr:hypothetical protein CON44_04055 [Bacillus cereus]PEW94259.1 hypothetical protein CN446_20485 [Bacillus cereus]PFP59115.1 hypothetical protein COK09_13850 [Bacillus cereus]PGK83552.1 hypothetical protein CN924_09735 [Bacillus cereus]PGK99682.1 hypothetical protein CN923_05845 [Bacillus cereus]
MQKSCKRKFHFTPSQRLVEGKTVKKGRTSRKSPIGSTNLLQKSCKRKFHFIIVYPKKSRK